MSNDTLENEYVTDTMVLVLRLEGRRTSPTVRSILDAVETGNVIVHIPAMALAEILYLSERQRIRATLTDLDLHLSQHSNYRVHPLNHEVIHAAEGVTDIRELHDRLIASTAVWLNLPLITNDPVIQASQSVRCIW